jgi:hypothetical protein
MGKGSIGDSLGCILMEVFSLIDLQNSSISGEGNGTKLQKLDPERISALIGLFILFPLFIKYILFLFFSFYY